MGSPVQLANVEFWARARSALQLPCLFSLEKSSWITDVGEEPGRLEDLPGCVSRCGTKRNSTRGPLAVEKELTADVCVVGMIVE